MTAAETEAPVFRHRGGEFNGSEAAITAPDEPKLRFGTGDFSIAVRVNARGGGDIVSKYDAAARRGFTLGIKTNYVTTSAANYRNLHFGIDAGVTGEWTSRGRPGNAIHVFALTVFDGRLYAGTCEPGEGQAGHVFRYAGGESWEDCGSPESCNAISALTAYEGKLYAGSARYNLAGSSLPVSPNRAPGGKVYRYDADGRWTDCGKFGEADAVFALTVYRGRLYGSTRYPPAGVYRYEGGRRWEFCGAPAGKRIEPMAVYQGALYGGSFDGGEIYRYEGKTEWANVGTLPDTTQTYSFAIHGGKLYASTWPNATVFRYDGDGSWMNCGRLGGEKEVMGMAVYNGRLYAGTLPSAEVYRYDGGRAWVRTGQLDRTPEVRYRRAWSMAVYDGKLFCGTLPSGRVYSLEAGRSATHDREFGKGWVHVTALRAGGRLRLYVDGRRVAESTEFDGSAYDVSNGEPLRIGLGDHDCFDGRMQDLRLYGRALGEREIAGLAGQPLP
ncbi:MAG TPA: LamG-like jellyroll fold domain-containing protein [Bryobacteraceae bacterium]|nr:LamG-like jellyroll fold domain-containing protein [Bryobacteraceae bacterium]